MFTGIIETTGQVESLKEKGTSKIFFISSPLSHELKVDQSIAHNGVCLTVEEVRGNLHRVTAILETLDKTNLAQWRAGTIVNLERCMRMNDRLDGHIVQGHTDCTATCLKVENRNGSWEYRFRFDEQFAALIIEKGSITVNGISLTAFDVSRTEFSVAIIPYTYEHTNIRNVQANDLVNLEFDMIGKYIQRKISLTA